MNSLQQMKEKLEAEQKAIGEAKKKADQEDYIAEQEAREETERRIKNAPQEIRDCIQKLNEYSRTGAENWQVDNHMSKAHKKAHEYNFISDVYECLCSQKAGVVPEFKKIGDNFKIVDKHPSFAGLLKNGSFTETKWGFIADRLKRKDLFSDYSVDCWYNALSEEPALANELVQAAREAKSARDTRKENAKKNRKIKVAAVSISVSILFFYLIFISRNISVFWGSVFTLMVIAEAIAIFCEKDGIIGHTMVVIIFFPILGGILGFIVGGIAWILSGLGTFTTVLWAIVIIIVNVIAIFLASDED